MTHLKQSSTIFRFTQDGSLPCTLETTQSVTSPNPSQTGTSKIESRYREQLCRSDVAFIGELNGRKAV